MDVFHLTICWQSLLEVLGATSKMLNYLIRNGWFEIDCLSCKKQNSFTKFLKSVNINVKKNSILVVCYCLEVVLLTRSSFSYYQHEVLNNIWHSWNVPAVVKSELIKLIKEH